MSTAINTSDVFKDPFSYCKECSFDGASCQVNTTLSKLDVRPGYWRHSNKTSMLYPCNNNSDVCRGSAERTVKSKKIEKNIITDYGDTYCKDGHRGPLCEVCEDDRFYFSDTDGQCIRCPTSGSVSVILIFVVLGAIAVIGAAPFLLAHYGLVTFNIGIQTKMKQKVSYFRVLVSSLSLQAKIKLLVSFYQIAVSLEDVYGVKFHSTWSGWMDLFSFLSLDFIFIVPIPVSCIANATWQQIVLGATWPFITILVGAIVLVVYKTYLKNKDYNNSGDHDRMKSHSSKLMKWAVQGTIILFYFTIPTVSRTIFDAIKCRAFDDDNQGGSVSYLMVNMEIECNRLVDSSYAVIVAIFWVLFAVWIVLIPLGFFGLLWYIREDVKSQRIQSLANSCRFLWNDYDPSMMHWDVLDTLRKIFLTGLIMLIDPQEGSNKMLRLVIASIVSVLYSFVLLAFRPYKRQGDYNLAFLSNFLLISCFSLGIILKLCNQDEDIGPDDGSQSFCSRFIGDSFNSYTASLLVVILLLSMLFTTTGFIVIGTLTKVRTLTVYMASTGHAPILELPEGCIFHVFVSHVWSTGQAMTHAIVRKMQLYMPGLKVWLDVDELEDISRLEEYVSESAIFVIYYSKGYFKSKNCRRELYAAIKLEKPIIVLYKGNSSVIEEMVQECFDNCQGNDSPGQDSILQRLLNNNQFNLQTMSTLPVPSSSHGPIQWLDEASFSSAALRLIYCRVLSHLPHYEGELHEEMCKDITVPDELGRITLTSPINILVSLSNQGCLDVAEDIKSMIPENESDMISICNDAAAFLNINEEASSENDNENGNVDDGKNNLIPQPTIFDRPTFLLLYLNEDTFRGSDQQRNEMKTIIETCIDNPNIGVILIQEQDVSKGACKFNVFFRDAPQTLINRPYNLFADIAIPLHSMEEYRHVSLNLILQKMNLLMKGIDHSS